MTYNVLLTAYAEKQFKKLPKDMKLRIVEYLENLAKLDDPTFKGDALTGKWKGHWKYRIGDYRIISKIEKNDLLVMVVEIGHRSSIYN